MIQFLQQVIFSLALVLSVGMAHATAASIFDQTQEVLKKSGFVSNNKLHFSGKPNLLSSANATQNINFDEEQATYEWVKYNDTSETQCASLTTYYELGFARGMRNIFLESPRWESKQFAGYAFGLSFPTAWADITVQQKPLVIERVAANGIHYVQSRTNPEVRFIVYLQDSELGYPYTAVCYNKDRPGSKEAVTEFLQEYESLTVKNSAMRGGVLEFKPSGKVGFFTGAEKLNYDWEKIILDAKTKTELQTTLEHFLQNYDREQWKRLGIPLSRGVLLDGPPGTGKSLIAKILMSRTLDKKYKSKPTFIYVSARHVTSKESIRNLYKIARQLNPSVVFFEDVDLIAGTGRTNKQEIKNELMQQLSGVEELEGVMTIATTNYGNLIDEALRRSRRLGFHHTIGQPKSAERQELFKLFLKDTRLDGVDFAKLGEASENMTGADIKELCRTAVENALRSNSKDDRKIIVRQSDLEFALNFRNKTRIQQTQKGE